MCCKAVSMSKLKLEMEELQKQEDEWKQKEDELRKKEKVCSIIALYVCLRTICRNLVELLLSSHIYIYFYHHLSYFSFRKLTGRF